MRMSVNGIRKWKRKSYRNQIPDLAASFTIEAALVMPVVLFSVLLLIMAAFELHDIVIGNLTVNEAAELYGHLPENGDRERIEQYGNERLKTVLSDIGYTMKIEEYRDGSRVELEFADGQREFEDSGSRPEKMMRAMTLLDAFTED